MFVSMAVGDGGRSGEVSSAASRWRLPEHAVVFRRGQFELPEDGGRSPRFDLLVTTEKALTHFGSRVQPTSASGASSPRRDLLLVSMPFADLRHPSIGLSLLKQLVKGVSCEILYLTLPFAERIGAALYDWISSGNPNQPCLVGEWLFSAALNDESVDGSRYLDEVLRVPEFGDAVTDGVMRNLLAIRREASPFLDRSVERILTHRPRIVGFTSVFQQHVASLALAQRLKKRDPEIFVVFGGANCEGVMGLEMMREFDFVDAVVSGEGEVVFPQLVERVLAGRPYDSLPGVHTQATAAAASPATRAPAVPKMDDLPFADFRDLFVAWDRSTIDPNYSPQQLFETSRGCRWGEKHHCTFCGLNGSSMTFRSKSSERALAELVDLTETYPGSKVAVVDNIMDMEYLRTLLPTLAERQLGVELFYEMKSNLRKDHLRLMRDAGLTEIQPGIESFSSDVLRLMEKGVSGLQNLQLLKWCRELGIRPYWNLLWGFPRESPEDYDRMAELIPWLTHLQPPVKAGPFRLDRFSPNFTRAAELGLDNVAPYPAYRHLYPGANGNFSNFAYYFEYGYQEEQKVADYTAAVGQRVAEWQDVHADSDLFFIDKAETLFVFDHRPAALAQAETVTALGRFLLLACDEIRSLDALARTARETLASTVDRADFEQTVSALVARGWLVAEGDQLLTLAVNAGSG